MQSLNVTNAMTFLGESASAETIVALSHLLEEAYQRGWNDGAHEDVKVNFWLGVKTGIIRHAWLQEGRRYVGAVASPQTELNQVLKGVSEEMDRALGKQC